MSNDTIIDVLNSIREELIRANDLKEVELGIKSDVEYKAEQNKIKKRIFSYEIFKKHNIIVLENIRVNDIRVGQLAVMKNHSKLF